jgi:hypothetical protein
MPNQQCTRCGWIWETNATRNNHETCESCRARKVQKVGACLPWHGRFASDMVTPIDEEGVAVLPGLRKCGRIDCISPSHIERG